MKQTIEDITPPLYLKDLSQEWWSKTKLTDEWLDIIFAEFYKKMNIKQDFYKRDYYELIKLMKPNDIDSEITEKLDLIFETIK